jgi:hypothetical protein
MRQVESQYNNRCYRLLQAYRNNKPRPQHVSPECWQWLIMNLWTDADFQVHKTHPKLQCCTIINEASMQFVNQKRSNQNSINRGKQEMGSKVGTRSMAQIAYDLVSKKNYQEIFFICYTLF